MNELRRLDLSDIKELRLLLFGKHGKGIIEIRSSPEDDGSEHGGDHTCDARLWDKSGQGCPVHDDLDFPVSTFGYTKVANRERFWPMLTEGIEFDVYTRIPMSPRDRSDDWELENRGVKFTDGKWILLH